VSDPHVRPHEHRVLRLTVDALKARRRLPHRDPLAVSAAWLRPNWPVPFVLTSHRERVVQLLMDDADLRAEVAKLVGIGVLSDTEQPTDADAMQKALVSAADPERVLESVATNPASAVADLAQPYLLGTLALPERVSPTATSTTGARPPGQPVDVRRELREAHANERRVEGELKAARADVERLQAQLQKTEEDLAAANAKAAQLQGMLPTRKHLTPAPNWRLSSVERSGLWTKREPQRPMSSRKLGSRQS
jgi:hypothetical protein